MYNYTMPVQLHHAKKSKEHFEIRYKITTHEDARHLFFTLAKLTKVSSIQQTTWPWLIGFKADKYKKNMFYPGWCCL